jgi:hypothetical protein
VVNLSHPLLLSNHGCNILKGRGRREKQRESRRIFCCGMSQSGDDHHHHFSQVWKRATGWLVCALPVASGELVEIGHIRDILVSKVSLSVLKKSPNHAAKSREIFFEQ